MNQHFVCWWSATDSQQSIHRHDVDKWKLFMEGTGTLRVNSDTQSNEEKKHATTFKKKITVKCKHHLSWSGNGHHGDEGFPSAWMTRCKYCRSISRCHALPVCVSSTPTCPLGCRDIRHTVLECLSAFQPRGHSNPFCRRMSYCRYRTRTPWPG